MFTGFWLLSCTLFWYLSHQYMQQGCRNGTNRGFYLYFSQLELEEVGAGGTHKHGREKLGVWFHLQQRREQKVNNRSKQEVHIKSLSSSKRT